jgi:hypothetical protein
MVGCILTRRENEQLFVRLIGRLGEAQVPELLEVCAWAEGPLVLELDELISADALGIDALLRIRQRGVRVVGMPEYIRLKLDVMEREQTP